MAYSLPPLPYAYDALEPYIDARTMKIHHTKHQQGYINKLNEALDKHPELKDIPLKDLMANVDSLPEDIRTSVRHNGGGTINHEFFFNGMMPAQDQKPEGALLDALVKQFGSFEAFKEEFNKSARTHFASGWTWLAATPEGQLQVYSTPGHDSPWMTGQIPLLCLDIWEHAYYLLYQNKRPDYIDQWWHVVNWQRAQDLYSQVNNGQ